MTRQVRRSLDTDLHLVALAVAVVPALAGRQHLPGAQQRAAAHRHLPCRQPDQQTGLEEEQSVKCS